MKIILGKEDLKESHLYNPGRIKVEPETEKENEKEKINDEEQQMEPN